ncbi:MAG TPA: hypothetical protein VG737_11870 [Cyclobacteriaceae bacterium]|nr:hypothetical protein [Cyclobacteriaceae bacterium]
MKKLMIIAALFVSTITFAQSNKEDIDIIQGLYGKSKKDIVAGFIAAPGAFWEVYDEYESKRKELGRKRVTLLEKYAANYGTMDDATTDGLIKEITTLGIQNDKLINTYYGKMKKVAGVKAAAQFVQIEVYFLSAIRVAILENIPFIGELD